MLTCRDRQGRCSVAGWEQMVSSLGDFLWDADGQAVLALFLIATGIGLGPALVLPARWTTWALVGPAAVLMLVGTGLIAAGRMKAGQPAGDIIEAIAVALGLPLVAASVSLILTLLILAVLNWRERRSDASVSPASPSKGTRRTVKGERG